MVKFGRKGTTHESIVVMLSVSELSYFFPTDNYLCIENMTYALSK